MFEDMANPRSGGAEDDSRYPAEGLAHFCREVFRALGMPVEHADVSADSLVRASLEGADSHGVMRLAIYAKRLREGKVSPRPQITVQRTDSILRVAGDNGLGQVVASHALEAAIPVARETGIAGVFITGTNHLGTLAYYGQRACEEEMALIATASGSPAIAPWGSRQPYLSTNPISFSFPVKDGPPVIVDMASSVAARGKAIVAQKRGEPIPKGWALDERGKETTDPSAALRGSMMPLGGAKGYALATAVQIMSSILTGSNFGSRARSMYSDDGTPSNSGGSFILIDISHWNSMDDYYVTMAQFLEEVGSSPLAEGVKDIFYPGERRYRSYLERSRSGIPVPGHIEAELRNVAEPLEVQLPLPV